MLSKLKLTQSDKLILSIEQTFTFSNIAGDIAAEHLHYGGIACYSCRAFFRYVCVLVTFFYLAIKFVPEYDNVMSIHINHSTNY